jgi:hypothetical protein
VENLLLKGLGFLIAGVIVSITLLGNNETYALFIKKFQNQIFVNAAYADNLIKNVELKEQSDGSIWIEIKRDSAYGYRPDIGFEIEGDIAPYILHMNPITVEKNGIYRVPLVTTINLHQFVELTQLKARTKQKSLSGWLTVKNFDGKVIATKDITINIDYLLNRVKDEIILHPPLQFYDIEGKNQNKITEKNMNEEYTENNTPQAITREELIDFIAPDLVENLKQKENEMSRLQLEIEALEKQQGGLLLNLQKNISKLKEENTLLKERIMEQKEEIDN